ncbi:ParA family protein [Stenotrophomonas sp. CFBP 13718]|uniref:ParA family protein n=2 Tax=unclassified Stenotrophomonas TaxID=196198 RepID=UPI002017584E|nr:ParA family protein [Stenotrophomonas sp. CFBP 13718]
MHDLSIKGNIRMRLVVCCFKGGVGRTTLSLNLAAAFAGQSRVLVNDRDPQCGSVAWAALSDETPFTVGRSSSPGFDLEIQDLPPSAPVKDQLPDGDLYIVPTLLDGGSYVVYLRTIETLRRQGKPFLPVANRVNLKRAEHRRRLGDPSLAGAVVIPERAALASYYELGETVFSMRGAGVKDAREDILRVGGAIQKRLTDAKGAA